MWFKQKLLLLSKKNFETSWLVNHSGRFVFSILCKRLRGSLLLHFTGDAIEDNKKTWKKGSSFTTTVETALFISGLTNPFSPIRCFLITLAFKNSSQLIFPKKVTFSLALVLVLAAFLVTVNVLYVIATSTTRRFLKEFFFRNLKLWPFVNVVQYSHNRIWLDRHPYRYRHRHRHRHHFVN